MGIFNDIFILTKLLLYAIFSSAMTFVRFAIVPNRFMFKSIENKVVLITGAAGGIGNLLVRSMLDLNCHVICVDLNQYKLDQLKSALLKDYPTKKTNIFCFKVDVTNNEEIEACAAIIKLDVGLPVDILINNAGIFNKGKLLTELSEYEIRNIFNVNILSQMWLCRQFLPDMLVRNQGHIINMSSSLGQFGGYRVTDYCATKFAVTGFTEALRIELKSLNKEQNVKVSLVSPYHIDNDFFKGFEMDSFKWAKVQKNDPKELVKTIINGIRLDKEIIGFPSVQFFLFLAVKNFLTTHTTDRMMMWFGFNDGIEKTRNFQDISLEQQESC